jgi:hypothetical protein
MKKLILAAAAITALGAAAAPAMADTVIKEGPRRVIVEHRPMHHLHRVVMFRHGHRIVVYR